MTGVQTCALPISFGAIRLARRTEWIEQPGGVYFGLGQRVLATDRGEKALMDLREIVLNPERTLP